ncbi:SAVED domain-containing protein, partial [Vibrio sp. 10N.286.45.C10]|uniref:SAVED domain-containing protein n=4 Tax=Vibrio TaxID=662 RepID=UPI00354D3427
IRILLCGFSPTIDREWIIRFFLLVMVHLISDCTHLTQCPKLLVRITFTCEIDKEVIPNELNGHTLFIRSNVSPQRNLIKNQENLSEAASFISSIVDELSQRKNVKRIHFFLSVQSSLAIAIGQRYQEGVHRKWVLHNFNAEEGLYDWGLEISSLGAEYFNSLELVSGRFTEKAI